jgi:hypothetical protein
MGRGRKARERRKREERRADTQGSPHGKSPPLSFLTLNAHRRATMSAGTNDNIALGRNHY